MNTDRRPIPDAVQRALETERASLLQRRAELVADIDVQISQLDEFIESYAGSLALPAGQTIEASQIDSIQTDAHGVPAASRNSNKIIVDKMVSMLRINKQMRVPEIYEKLVSEGVTFTAKNPRHRITQILSERKGTLFARSTREGEPFWTLHDSIRGDVPSELVESRDFFAE